MADNVRSGILGLDRKAMEEERLARARKRTVEQACLDEPPVAAKTMRSELPNSSNAKLSSTCRPSVRETRPRELSNMSQTSPSSLQYRKGTIKRTHSPSHHSSDSITFAEVLQSATLTTALISGWQFDFDYLARYINPKQTKFILTLEAKNESDKNRWRQEFAGLEKSIRLCFPPMSGNIYARMHSKLMLLFHPTHLRIVIPSANPVAHDWGECGLLENQVFLIDLPRRNLQGEKEKQTTSFQIELIRFLEAMDAFDDLIVGVSNFDFSQTDNMAFIHSIPGTYEGSAATMTGVLSLARAVQALNCAPTSDQPTEIDCASASIGSLDMRQIDTFRRSLRGESPERLPSSTHRNSASATVPRSTESRRQDFRLIFPSHETVQRSRGGEDAAGTIFLKSSAFHNPSFPRDLLHDYESTRPGLLSHNKLILVRSPSTAYLYTGSANLSASAWGRVTYNSAKKASKTKPSSVSRSTSTSDIKVSIVNWECGVLVPVTQHKSTNTHAITVVSPDKGEQNLFKERRKSGKTARSAIALDDFSTESESDGKSGTRNERAQPGQAKAEGEGNILPYNVFSRVLDVPFKCPPRKYATDEKPWLQ